MCLLSCIVSGGGETLDNVGVGAFPFLIRSRFYCMYSKQTTSKETGKSRARARGEPRVRAPTATRAGAPGSRTGSR